MDAQRIAIAQACVDGARHGTLSFPQIVGKLAEAGLEGYLVDYRGLSQTFYAGDGDSVSIALSTPHSPVADGFDAAAIAALVRWAQANGPDYSYAAFCERVTAAGCAGYLVSLPGRRVVYFGRTGETHVEHMPK